ncbi:sigma-70 family RNA polymerase sigma factor [bacterium]|nr:sigma-70 family RNA polymerase sigma factor [bacterium]MDY3757541.1 sigma-70 family RNA polymerase sigma factor [Bacilli bacterium]
MSRVNTLSSAKNRELFTKLKNGDTSVRETIIKGNINLVYYTFSRYFKNLEVKEYEDLGLIGLIKAVDSYDVEKNADFATFSIICIKNEILGELKKISKTKGDVSLYDGIPWLIEDDEDMQLINCIPDSKDLIDDFISSVSYEKITSELFATLTDKEKELLKLFFGFYEKKYTQKEIASIYGVHQSQISRTITRICYKLKEVALSNCPEIKNDFEI